MFNLFNKKRIKSYLLLLFLMFVLSNTNFSDEPKQKKEIGFDEKLGETLPLELSFLDEYGQPVKLKELFKKPTLFMLVYYRCPGLCSPFLSGVENVVDNLDLEADKDYNLITISFDPNESYIMASEKKKNYFDEMKKKIPQDSWRFLTGDSLTDKKISDAVGFRYIKQGKDYMHATGLITVSPDGKISRYLYGTEFNPFDVKMALIEASEGKSTPTISKLVKLCYSYDPADRHYVLNITRIAGGGLFILLLAFIAVLTIRRKKNINIERKNING